ncbi:MAG: UPF0149 family protein [Burkholderiaceae bacterium]
MATPQQQPPAPRNVAHDLTDVEFAELDTLLERTPEPLEPVDAVMLDGYLCGVLVQPVLLQPEAWLPHVFDFDGRPLPDDVDPLWRDRVVALTLRRHAALNRALADDGWFDPLVLEFDAPDAEDTPVAVEAGEVVDSQDTADAVDASATVDTADTADTADRADSGAGPASGLSPISESLMPWVAGFQHAALSFPDLSEMPDDAVMTALARLYRHLPAETPEEREVVATLDRESPLATLDEAMEELVATVADLYDLTREQRYKVDTVKRDAPKVGRNDPCPCGSGKKFKQCHGA